MKILVTGGAGFIGSHSVDRLVSAGHETFVLDDLSTGALENLNKEAAFVRMSILDDGIFGLFEQERFDAVLHLAAQTIVPSSLARPDTDARVNVLGTLQILEGCRRTGVRKIVFASSAAVYGDVAELPVPETAAGAPTSFYGLSKLTAERYVQMYQTLHGLPYLILRYANVYGDRQGDSGEGGVVSIFARSMSEQKKVTVFGDGLQTRDFIYVGDIAEANLQALICRYSDGILNIGTQTEATVVHLASVLAKLTGYNLPLEHLKARPGDIVRSMLRNSEAKRLLGWAPSTGLSAGLEKTCRYIHSGKGSS